MWLCGVREVTSVRLFDQLSKCVLPRVSPCMRHSCGCGCLQGTDSLERDYREAARLFQVAYTNGHTLAGFALGEVRVTVPSLCWLLRKRVWGGCMSADDAEQRGRLVLVRTNDAAAEDGGTARPVVCPPPPLACAGAPVGEFVCVPVCVTRTELFPRANKRLRNGDSTGCLLDYLRLAEIVRARVCFDVYPVFHTHTDHVRISFQSCVNRSLVGLCRQSHVVSP